MKTNTDELNPQNDLQDFLQAGQAPRFRPGFEGRVMARIKLGENSSEVSMMDAWILRLSPQIALVAACLVLMLAGLNLGSSSDGNLMDRLLQLPELSISNGLSYEGENS